MYHVDYSRELKVMGAVRRSYAGECHPRWDGGEFREGLICSDPILRDTCLSPSYSQSNVSDVLPDGTVSSMPWRKAGVKYSQNEVYLDIVEEVDAIVGVNGQVRQDAVAAPKEVGLGSMRRPDAGTLSPASIAKD